MLDAQHVAEIKTAVKGAVPVSAAQ